MDGNNSEAIFPDAFIQVEEKFTFVRCASHSQFKVILGLQIIFEAIELYENNISRIRARQNFWIGFPFIIFMILFVSVFFCG